MRADVVITGITGLRNRGVEALMRPLLDHLAGDATAVTVLSSTPEYDTWRLRDLPRVRVRPDPFLAGTGRLGRLRRRVAERVPRAEATWSDTRALLRSARLVVAMGGDLFTSDYGDLDDHLAPLAVALDAGVPVAFLAQSVGPFATPAEADSFAAVARRAALVTARESITERYLLDELALDPARVRRTADLAFLLDPGADAPRRMARTYGTEEGRRVVLVPSQGVSRYSGLDGAAHRDAWVAIARAVLDGVPEAEVAVLAHVQEASPGNDDRVLATEVAEAVGRGDRVRLVLGEHSAADLKAYVSTAQLVVSERMHAAIAGLSSGVCTVPVGYSIKARGILGDLLGAERGERLLLPVDRLMEPAAASARILEAWTEREAVASELAAVLPEARRRARENLAEVDGLLGRTSP